MDSGGPPRARLRGGCRRFLHFVMERRLQLKLFIMNHLWFRSEAFPLSSTAFASGFIALALEAAIVA